MKSRVLVVDDEKLIRWTLCETMRRAGHEVLEAADGVDALEIAERELPDAILLDLRMPRMDGLTVLSELARGGIDTAVVVVTAQSDLETAVEAMRLGADDFLKKPFDADEVVLVVTRALERHRAHRELTRQHARSIRAFSVERLVGKSASTQAMRAMISRLADSETRGILLSGESGTGKGLVARILHYASPRNGGSFVQLTATGRDDESLEREIFGFEKTAVPGATAAGRGLVERAGGGTLYLEDVAGLPLICQARLVDVIENRVLRRVGGARSVSADVRVIAATTEELQEKVAAGQFREDLFYLLSSVPLRLLPLRERLEDLPALAEVLTQDLAAELSRSWVPLAPPVLQRLQEHDWPGNVRELRNVLERAAILAGDRTIGPGDISPAHPPQQLGPDARDSAEEENGEFSISGHTLEEVEREMIRRALETTEGNQAQAARALGLSRDTLRYRIKKFGF